MINPVVIYEGRNSSVESKHIELDHFVSMFQDAFCNNEIVKCFYSNGKIVALGIDGELISDII